MRISPLVLLLFAMLGCGSPGTEVTDKAGADKANPREAIRRPLKAVVGHWRLVLDGKSGISDQKLDLYNRDYAPIPPIADALPQDRKKNEKYISIDGKGEIVMETVLKNVTNQVFVVKNEILSQRCLKISERFSGDKGVEKHVTKLIWTIWLSPDNKQLTYNYAVFGINIVETYEYVDDDTSF